MVTVGGPIRARWSARRRASGSRYRPVMCRTRSAASAAGIPAAVTNNGRAEEPHDRHRVGSRAEPGLGPPNHRDAELGMRMRTQARPAAGLQVGGTIDHQQAQPAHTVQDRAQRWEFAQVELTWPVGRYPGYHRGAFA